MANSTFITELITDISLLEEDMLKDELVTIMHQFPSILSEIGHRLERLHELQENKKREGELER